MRSLFLNTACILILFNIEAPVNEKLEANFNDEGFVRYPLTPSVFVKVVAYVDL